MNTRKRKYENLRFTEIHGPEKPPRDWIVYQYRVWRQSAKHRRIEVQMTLEEWWGAWSPHWNNREQTGLVMARHGDVGPYAVGNIYFTTRAQNVEDGVRFKRERSAAC